MVKEEAQELLEALWVKQSDVIKAGTYSSAKITAVLRQPLILSWVAWMRMEKMP